MKKNYRKGPKSKRGSNNKRPLIIKRTNTIVAPNTPPLAVDDGANSSNDKILWSKLQLQSFKQALLVHVSFAILYGLLMAQVIYDMVNSQGFSIYRMSFTHASGVFVEYAFLLLITIVVFEAVIIVSLKSLEKALDVKNSYICLSSSMVMPSVILLAFVVIMIFINSLALGMAMVIIVVVLLMIMMAYQITNLPISAKNKAMAIIVMLIVLFWILAYFLSHFLQIA
ncbi:MAG: hypothetical protein MR210_08440 [Erysipelotrichaceae bacterium]|nr:hypothetical protein [Erysipelotrichaceae bacterium]MDY5252308.1 hypothetical protein [Erysipelotrichaceae bacterium]